jgi:hypothetical protein
MLMLSKTGFQCTATSERGGAWHVQNVFPKGAAHLLTWKEAIDELSAGTLGPFLDEVLQISPHSPHLYWETPPFSRQVPRPALHPVSAQSLVDYLFLGSCRPSTRHSSS